MKNLPQGAQTILVTKTGTVHKGPALVCSVVISADGANGDAQIYDGENALREEKYHLEALAGTTSPNPIERPSPFDNGIHVVVNAATTHVMIQYIPESYKKFE